MTARDLVARVAAAPRVTVSGTFYRHAQVGTQDVRGSNSGGRWGPPGGFEVIYLGRPEASIIIEAHRHLVEVTEGMRPEFVGPRSVVVVEVAATELLDLRSEATRANLGLDHTVTFSEARDPDAYATCQQVGRAAHQLELHGLISPAAGGFGGETLALFPANLPHMEVPVVESVRTWDALPPDPRKLRLLDERERDGGGSGCA